ncbi:hypothetical protein N7254_26355, partial [Escherichia coli]|nr:hypothetical protein [Escherichia coli]
NRLIRCVCGKKIGPDPRNFNQRVSLGRNDLLIRTFLSGCVSVREWMQSQVNEQTNEDLHLDFDNMDFHRTNPATGLPMSGIGVDIGGNSYGYSSKRYDE